MKSKIYLALLFVLLWGCKNPTGIIETPSQPVSETFSIDDAQAAYYNTPKNLDSYLNF